MNGRQEEADRAKTIRNEAHSTSSPARAPNRHQKNRAPPNITGSSNRPRATAQTRGLASRAPEGGGNRIASYSPAVRQGHTVSLTIQHASVAFSSPTRPHRSDSPGQPASPRPLLARKNPATAAADNFLNEKWVFYKKRGNRPHAARIQAGFTRLADEISLKQDRPTSQTPRQKAPGKTEGTGPFLTRPVYSCRDQNLRSRARKKKKAASPQKKISCAAATG